MLGAQGLHDFAWSGIRRLYVQAILEMLGDAGRAPCLDPCRPRLNTSLLSSRLNAFKTSLYETKRLFKSLF
jgi:hypothetical protein